jgi:hypothetical protein
VLHIEFGGKIRLTRGDTAKVSVEITNATTGEAYTIAAGDRLTMTVKRSIADAEHILQKVLTGERTFNILQEDTAGLEFGKYIYDVQLDTADGETHTVIEPATFEILQEVTQ